MTPIDEKDLEEIFYITSLQGWNHLIKDVEEREEVMKEALTRGEISSYEIGFVQGKIAVYRELKTLRRMIEMSLQEAKEYALEQAANI